MRKLLLLAVIMSSVFAHTATARGNSGYSNGYDSSYDQGYNDAEDDATDWEDDMLPSPQHDTQNAAVAMCGPHTLYMDATSNVAVVDGETWYLVDGDVRPDGFGDRLITSHYVKSAETSQNAVTIGVLEKSKKFMLIIKDSPVYNCRLI